MDFNFSHGFNQTTQSGFASFLPQNVSAYFRKPSRIVKPGSRNQSPRSGRRRMTATFPTRNRSVAEPHRSNNSEEYLYPHKPQTRPVSWHSSFHYPYHAQSALPQQYCQSPSDVICNETMMAYGLITPQAAPVGDEAYVNTQMIPLSLSSSGPQFTSDPIYSQTTPYMYPQEFDDHASNYTPVSAPIYDVTDYQLQGMAWPPLPISNLNIATAPASPDYTSAPPGVLLPQAEVEDDKEELIGMGLYDPPAQAQAANLLFGGSLPIRRKSLKLEESFEPAPPSDDEELDGEVEVEPEEDDDAESEPEPEQVNSQQVSHEPAITSYVPDPIQQYYNSLMQDQMRSMPVYSSNMPGWI